MENSDFVVVVQAKLDQAIVGRRTVSSHERNIGVFASNLEPPLVAVDEILKSVSVQLGRRLPVRRAPAAVTERSV